MAEESTRFRRTAISLVLAAALAAPLTGALARDTLIKPQTAARGPMLVVVSLRKQKLRIFDVGGEIASSRVSSGKPGFDTPTGVFSVLEKKAIHHSNIYSGAPMPFMQRLTWSGIALHAGDVPGYRASHGCIRLPRSFAQSLFGLTSSGIRVVVAQDESQPVPFSHPRLFKPLPEQATAQVASAATTDLRLASNDAGPSPEALSEFRNFLGVTPALAAAAADWRSETARPRTRADADRRVAERVAIADSKVKTALLARSAAADGVKAAVDAAASLATRLRDARRSVEPDRRAVRTAEAGLASAHKTFETAMRGPVALRSDEAEDREGDLEDAILDARIAVDETHAASARGELELAALEAEAGAAERARTAAAVAGGQIETDLKSAQTELAEMTKDAARRSKPMSVLISVRTGRVYIRQGFQAVLEAPISISGPPRKIGTYVLTAMRYDPNNPDAFDWRLVTAQSPSYAAAERDNRKRRSQREQLAPAQGSAAAVLGAALEGIKIPEEILQTITERARPGASLIITDRDLNQNENGLNTEFVLLTR